MKSFSQQTNADLVRLRKIHDVMENHKTIQALLRRDEALDEAAEIWVSKCEKDDSFVLATRDIAKLLCKTKSLALYDKVGVTRRPWGIFELVTLYECKFPDQRIERNLMDRLYRIAGDDEQAVFRRVIIDAVIRVGTVETIPVLEAILWDNTRSLDAKVAIANAISAVGEKTVGDRLTVLLGKVAKSFVESVVEAVSVVKERGDSPIQYCSASGTNLPGLDKPIVSNAHFELERAISFVSDEPDVAIMCVRRGAEAIGKHLYRHLGLKKDGRPADKLMLGALLEHIKESDSPRVFKDLMESIRPFGNFASHDQDTELEHFSSKIARSVVDQYEEALRIYEKWLRESTAE